MKDFSTSRKLRIKGKYRLPIVALFCACCSFNYCKQVQNSNEIFGFLELTLKRPYNICMLTKTVQVNSEACSKVQTESQEKSKIDSSVTMFNRFRFRPPYLIRLQGS